MFNSYCPTGPQMAKLPHMVTIKKSTKEELQAVLDWCWRQWPHTHGATWSESTWIGQELLVHKQLNICQRMAFQHFSFQREEDAVAFRLAWG